MPPINNPLQTLKAVLAGGMTRFPSRLHLELLVLHALPAQVRLWATL
jgi:hypothetical protein